MVLFHVFVKHIEQIPSLLQFHPVEFLHIVSLSHSKFFHTLRALRSTQRLHCVSGVLPPDILALPGAKGTQGPLPLHFHIRALIETDQLEEVTAHKPHCLQLITNRVPAGQLPPGIGALPLPSFFPIQHTMEISNLPTHVVLPRHIVTLTTPNRQFPRAGRPSLGDCQWVSVLLIVVLFH
jgi:hypothetical protein